MCYGENTTGKGTVVIHRECHPEKSQQAHSLFKEQPACGPLVLVLTVRKKICFEEERQEIRNGMETEKN